MPILSQLIKTISEILDVPKRSGPQYARGLRDAGLISVRGRGPSAAIMTPTDATNLLLGLMASTQIRTAAEAVVQARALEYRSSEVNMSGVVDKRIPPYPFFKSGGTPPTLGDVLDGMFNQAITENGLLDDAGARLRVLDFMIIRPGVFAAIKLDTLKDCWEAHFGEPASPHECRMSVEAIIGHQEFFRISDALRGDELTEAERENE